QARRVGARPADFEVFAQVASFARSPRTVTVDLTRETPSDGGSASERQRLVDSRRVELAPGERRAVVFTGTHAGAARLTGALQGRGALAVDDRAYVALQPSAPRRVAFAGEPDPWVERALSLLPGVAVSKGASSPDGALLVCTGDAPPAAHRGPLWLIA